MRGEGGSYATTEHRIHHLLTRLRRIDRDAATLKIMRLARIVVLMVMGSILIFALSTAVYLESVSMEGTLCLFRTIKRASCTA